MDITSLLSSRDTPPLEEPSNAEAIVDYSDLVAESIFIGDTPYDTIIDCIRGQFDDYINLDDKTDYVDVFYTQLANSYAAAEEDEDEYHLQEVKEALEKLSDNFVEFMIDLFEVRFTIHVSYMDECSVYISDEEMESNIRNLYDFFVLKARNNFKVAITKDIIGKIDFEDKDDSIYYQSIKDHLSDYSPLVRCMDARQFLVYCEDEDILDIFDSGKATGNFLRKFSCKLYQNEEFEVELISYITTVQNLKEELING